MRGACLLLAAVTCGCGRTGGAPEAVGDQAYAGSHYRQAWAAYSAAGGGGSALQAKLAAAALGAGLLDSAAAAWARLAARDPTRTDEAATGLDLVARRAADAGDTAALHRAVLALRTLAPTRPLGRLALELTRRVTLPPVEAAAVLPAALAEAADPETVDSLLLRYGAALSQTADCGGSTAAFHAVLARTSDPAAAQAARSGLAGCALRLGLAALGDNRPGDAERWFSDAAGDSVSVAGRRGMVGLGDALLAQHDTVGAIAAWGAALRLSGADSIAALARARLARLAPAGDTTRSGAGAPR